MIIKDILVHVEPGPGSEARLKYAISMASLFGARLTGVAATPPLSTTIPKLMGELPYSDALIEGAARSTASAKAQFDRVTTKCALQVRWHDGGGVAIDVIAAAAGSADVVIIGREDRRDLEGSFYDLSPADVVMACGRPVLVLPDAAPETFCAARIMIGWKNTPQAARAIHDALPLLTRAKEIVLAEVVSERQSVSRYEIPIEAVAEHLRQHGMAINILKIPLEADDAGYSLIKSAAENKSDLIVTGAYGHNRVREWALGGVTYSLLHTGSFPCLLSH